jgi:hypothetical protein
MEVYLEHKYFSSVVSWDSTMPSTTAIGNHLCSELLRTIPASRRPAYMNQDKCKDGFVFLKLWMSDISPSNTFHKLQCILKFSSYSAGDTPGQAVLSEARGLLAALKVIDTEALILMRMILAFEVTAFRRGDPTVAGCTLDHLQRLVQDEDDRLAVMNINSSSASANRTRKPDLKQSSDPPKDQPTPTGTMVVPYPPTRGVPFKACSEPSRLRNSVPFASIAIHFTVKLGAPALQNMISSLLKMLLRPNPSVKNIKIALLPKVELHAASMSRGVPLINHLNLQHLLYKTPVPLQLKIRPLAEPHPSSLHQNSLNHLLPFLLRVSPTITTIAFVASTLMVMKYNLTPKMTINLSMTGPM